MKNKIEFAVGAFLALALAALMVLAFASTNGKWSLGGGTYTIKAKFPNTGALRVNAPVKVGGVAIGAVSDIALDKNYDAVATLAIKDEYKLSADTSASILTSGLLGESYVNLQPGGDAKDLRNGDELFITQGAVDLMSLVGKFMFSGGAEKEPQNSGNDSAPPPVKDKATESDSAPVENTPDPAAEPALPDYLQD